MTAAGGGAAEGGEPRLAVAVAAPDPDTRFPAGGRRGASPRILAAMRASLALPASDVSGPFVSSASASGASRAASARSPLSPEATASAARIAPASPGAARRNPAGRRTVPGAVRTRDPSGPGGGVEPTAADARARRRTDASSADVIFFDGATSSDPGDPGDPLPEEASVSPRSIASSASSPEPKSTSSASDAEDAWVRGSASAGRSVGATSSSGPASSPSASETSFPRGGDVETGPAAADILSRRFLGGPARVLDGTFARLGSRAEGEGTETRGDSSASVRNCFFFSGVRASTKAATRARSRRARASSEVSSGSGSDGSGTP